MSDPFEKVRAFITRHSMFEDVCGVVVAVSGGPDSVALLDMLFQIIKADYKSEIGLHVAHLDHRLRDQESDEDARFVRALAEKLNLPCSIGSIDVRAVAESKGRGIEETAREVRYNFLTGIANRLGFDRIATGHSMNDQAETFLMRLARGAGLRGLGAMRAVSDAPIFTGEQEWENGRVGLQEMKSAGSTSYHLFTSSPFHLLRPLLCITREEVEEYCHERNLEYKTDSTNLEMNYGRNRVRHLVLPAMRELNPRIVEAIARASEVLASEQDALSSIVEALMRDALIEKDSSDARLAYSISVLFDQSAALRRRMIIEALRRARSVVGTGHEQGEIELRHIAEIEQLINQGTSGGHITLPGGIDVWREFDSLVFLRRQAEIEKYEFEISSDNSVVEVGGLRLELLRGQVASSLNALIEQAKRERVQKGFDWMMVVLDDDSLDEKLIVRTRKEGERAVVSGHSKTKKLKKLMIGHRIAPSRRNTWPVVATSDGRYVWSPRLPPASEFAPHNKTRQLAILRASEI